MGIFKKIGKGVGGLIKSGADAVTGDIFDFDNSNQPRRSPQQNFTGFPRIPTPGDLGRGSQPTLIPSGGFDPFGNLIDFPAADQFFNTGAGSGMVPNVQQDIAQLLGTNQIAFPAGTKQVADCPKGFRAVTMPDGTKMCVLESVGKKLGLVKTRSKPPISASDWKKLKRADVVKRKAKKIAQTADFKCTKK